MVALSFNRLVGFMYSYSIKRVIMSSIIRSAFSLTSSGLRPPRGWGIITKGRCGIPKFSTVVRAKNSKQSVHIVTVGLPLFSSSTESWTLHVVQDPQSAIAFITKSEVRVSSSMVASSAGTAAVVGF